MSQIESQNHNIIENGTVCTFEDEPLTIAFGPSADPLAVTFTFKENESNKPEQKGTAEGKTLKLELFNFTNVLGTGNIVPIEIGKLNEKKLHISFRVYAMTNSKTKLIHYTIYQEK